MTNSRWILAFVLQLSFLFSMQAAETKSCKFRAADNNCHAAEDHLLVQLRQGASLTRTKARKADELEADALTLSCRTTLADEKCYKAISWARDVELPFEPKRFAGLTRSSSLEDFQLFFYNKGLGQTWRFHSLDGTDRACEGGEAGQMDANFLVVDTSSFADCQKACLLTSGCKGFDVGESDGSCRLFLHEVKRTVAAIGRKCFALSLLEDNEGCNARPCVLDLQSTNFLDVDEDIACRTTVQGDTCYVNVAWAKNTGIYSNPQWYPGLTSASTFEAFQAFLYSKGLGSCTTPPCPSTTAATTKATVALTTPTATTKPTTKATTATTTKGTTKAATTKATTTAATTKATTATTTKATTTAATTKATTTAATTKATTTAATTKATTTAVTTKASTTAATTKATTAATTKATSTATQTTPLLATGPLIPATPGVTGTVSPDCEAVWNTLAVDKWSSGTCGGRINWLVSARNMEKIQAQIQVSLEHDVCSACWPWPKYKVAGDTSVSGKRGFALTNSRLTIQSLSSLSKIVSWGYTWDFLPTGAHATGPDLAEWKRCGINFIPMIWGTGPSKLTKAQQVGLPPGSLALLGFNEPNFPEQANMSPSVAASLWPQLETLARAAGITKIVSPAVNFAAYDPIQWLTDFLAACVGCQVDAIAFHSYTCYGKYLQGHIAKYKVFKKPLWLTEFACSDGSSPERLPADGQIAYMREAIPLLEQDPDIEMYAWFSYFQDQWAYPIVQGLNGDAGLVYPNGTLSKLGEVYGTFASTKPRPAPPIPAATPCRTTLPGEACYVAVQWAMTTGINSNPAWYPGLTKSSSFRDFQNFFFNGKVNGGVCSNPAC